MGVYDLGSKTKINSIKPPTPLCPLNMTKNGFKMVWNGSVKLALTLFHICAKWLLTKHLRKVHGLMVEKVKPKRASTSQGGFRHQDHAKMNVCILGGAMAIHWHNDQKVTNHTHAKAQYEWDELVIIGQ